MSCKNYIKPYCQDFNIEISTPVFEAESTEIDLPISCDSVLEIVNFITWTDEDYSLETNG